MLAQEALMSYALLNNAVFTNPVVVDAIIDLYTPAQTLLTDRIFPQVAAQKLNLISTDLVHLQDYAELMRVNVISQSILHGVPRSNTASPLRQSEELLMSLVLVLDDMLGLLALSSKATIPLGATA